MKIAFLAMSGIRAHDPELLDLMAQAGCRQVLIGLESLMPEALAGLEHRADFKRRRAAGALEAVRVIQARGITVNGCFVLGLDQHSPEIFDQVERFANEAGLYDVQITVQTAFPGTPLYRRLESEGRLLEPGRWDLCTLFDVNYEPERLSVGELRDGLRDLSRRLYTARAQHRRRRRFFEQRSGVERVSA